MRGARVIWALGAAALACAASAVRAVARHRTAATSRAALGPIACHQAVDPHRREVALQATMRPVAQTRSLEIKFALSVSSPGAPASPVVAPGLRQWLMPSDPTLGSRPRDLWTR